MDSNFLFYTRNLKRNLYFIGSAGNVKSPLVGTSIKSPSSGLSIKSPGMRVGLSRNQRVRSLHPGLTLKTT